MDLFLGDMGRLPPAVKTVLKQTSAWVRTGVKDPMRLLEAYAWAAVSRKADQARLSNSQFGVDRRREWQRGRHGRAEPNHYRWANVKRLLRDLEGVA